MITQELLKFCELCIEYELDQTGDYFKDPRFDKNSLICYGSLIKI